MSAITDLLDTTFAGYDDQVIVRIECSVAELKELRQAERDLATVRAENLAHEAVMDACFDILPDCQVWGDVPGIIAELQRDLAVAQAKYNELILDVGNKYPGETRHETALRYIRQAENQDNPPAAKIDAKEGE